MAWGGWSYKYGRFTGVSGLIMDANKQVDHNMVYHKVCTDMQTYGGSIAN